MGTRPERHEMQHRGTYPSGAQEWSCPECGRHFVVRWPPNYQRLVLNEGDGDAVHVGAKGDVRLGSGQVTPSAEAEQAWRRWLDDIGIDWDGWVA